MKPLIQNPHNIAITAYHHKKHLSHCSAYSTPSTPPACRPPCLSLCFLLLTRERRRQSVCDVLIKFPLQSFQTFYSKLWGQFCIEFISGNIIFPIFFVVLSKSNYHCTAEERFLYFLSVDCPLSNTMRDENRDLHRADHCVLLVVWHYIYIYICITLARREQDLSERRVDLSHCCVG